MKQERDTVVEEGPWGAHGPSDAAAAEWDEVGVVLRAYTERLGLLVERHRGEIVPLIRHALDAHRGVKIAIDLLPLLTEAEQKALLPTMLALCSSGRAAHIAKSFILELPRDWLLGIIEAEAEPVLAHDDFLDWCNILDVFRTLDRDLGRRFAERMTRHIDPEIAEWGTNYLASR